MDANSLDRYLALTPVPTLRLTLSSGDQVIIDDADDPFIEGITLILGGRPKPGRFATGPKMISVPNIVLVEPIEVPPPKGRGRKRNR
jgi:hypothetical protein